MGNWLFTWKRVKYHEQVLNCENAKAINVDLQLWIQGSITKNQTWYNKKVSFLLYMHGETFFKKVEDIDNCHFGNISVGIEKWSTREYILLEISNTKWGFNWKIVGRENVFIYYITTLLFSRKSLWRHGKFSR